MKTNYSRYSLIPPKKQSTSLLKLLRKWKPVFRAIENVIQTMQQIVDFWKRQPL